MARAYNLGLGARTIVTGPQRTLWISCADFLSNEHQEPIAHHALMCEVAGITFTAGKLPRRCVVELSRWRVSGACEPQGPERDSSVPGSMDSELNELHPTRSACTKGISSSAFSPAARIGVVDVSYPAGHGRA